MALINIVFSTSEYYLLPTICSIVSIIDNASEKCDFIILSNGLSARSKQKFCLIAKDAGVNIDVLEISGKLEELAREFGLPKSRGSYSTYSRIFLAEILPNLDHVWLLDSDTLVLGDICELKQYSDHTIAAVPDQVVLNKHSCHESWDLSNKLYFNMGVVGLNLKKWRELNLLGKLRDEFDQSEPLKIVDQTVVNRYFSDYIYRLHQKYNFYTYFHHELPYDFLSGLSIPRYFLGKEEFTEAKEAPVIIHFIGFWFERPWFIKSYSPFKRVYSYYWKKLELYGLDNQLYSKPTEGRLTRLYSALFSTLLAFGYAKTHYKIRYIYIQKVKKFMEGR